MTTPATAPGPAAVQTANWWAHRAILAVVLAAVYLLAVVAANWLTVRYGEIPILPGVTVVAGTFAAGLAILTRNLGQDVLGRWLIICLMVLGCLLSWWLASPKIAVASAVAFGVSETVDMTVYTWLRTRGRPRALAVAGTLGSIADTALFLWLAHLALPTLPITPAVVTGQLLVKAGISLVAAAELRRRRYRTA